jgi:hypothetical protein
VRDGNDSGLGEPHRVDYLLVVSKRGDRALTTWLCVFCFAPAASAATVDRRAIDPVHAGAGGVAGGCCDTRKRLPSARGLGFGYFCATVVGPASSAVFGAGASGAAVSVAAASWLGCTAEQPLLSQETTVADEL